MVFGRPLLLKILLDYFTFDYEELSHFPIWVQLKNLPLELWGENALSMICSRIGRVVYIGKLNTRQERISYAKVLVEVDVAKSVSHMVEITMPNGVPVHQTVFYENMPLFCTHCKTVRHSTSGCKVLEKFTVARNKGAKNQDGKLMLAAKTPAKNGQNTRSSLRTEMVIVVKSNKVSGNPINTPTPNSENNFIMLERILETEEEQIHILGAKSSSAQIQEIISDKAQAVKIVATNLGNKFRVTLKLSSNFNARFKCQSKECKDVIQAVNNRRAMRKLTREGEIAHYFREGNDTDATSSETDMGRFKTLGQKKFMLAADPSAIAAFPISQVPLPTPNLFLALAA
ncbi:uncharacterized protein LOC130768942 [Actinidia eriantha]|uniref:uncharacterized protein LOC130768942 n=1 Tax=Actinidia eriantha TaxID=165200 RepID=UPI0025862132|nr:uncharacterized protein LOC130768942 [Actinidia eriantha]